MRLQVRFAKHEDARFLSHLDLLAALEFAVRRARLPVELSAGFNPRPKVTLAAALPLGYIGRAEILEIVLREEVPVPEVVRRLQDTLPNGVEITDAQEIAPGKSLGSRLRSAHYTVHLPASVPDLTDRIDRLLSADIAEVEEHRQEGPRRRNVRPLLEGLEAVDPAQVRIVVDLSGRASVRPEQVLQLMSIPTDGIRIVRESVEIV